MRFVFRCCYLLLGAILGPGACESAPEYGPPPTPFLLDGTVVAASTGTPIRGISVDFDGLGVLTDLDGKWSIEGTVFQRSDLDALEVRDVDGPDNGGQFAGETFPLDPTLTGDGILEHRDIRIDLEPSG